MPLALLSLVLVVSGAAMTMVPYVLFGIEIPRSVAVVFGVLAVLLGGWFGFAVMSRFRSSDPAIDFKPQELVFHANPGHRFTLKRNEIRGVQGPISCTGMQRWIFGDELVRIKTSRKEGFRASDVVLGQAHIASPLEEVIRQVEGWRSEA